jgi:hypothetical protein
MVANRLFFEEMSKNPSILTGETINEIGVAHLIYAGYQNNCIVKGIEPELKFHFFMEWVEEALVDPEVKKTLDAVSQCYADSRFTKKCIEEINERTEDLKKKIEELTGTSSNLSVIPNSEEPTSSIVE